KRVFMPPERTTSRSSMLSAPAHIPAINVANFGEGLADPDLIFGAGMQILSANSSGSPVWVARVMTGTSPAHDTRCSSSNTADSAANLCETCTGSALSELIRLMPREHQSFQLRGHFPRYDTRWPANSSTDRGSGCQAQGRRAVDSPGQHPHIPD